MLPQPLTILLFILLHRASAVDILFNTFNSTSLLLYGVTTVQSSVLTLTDSTPFSVGRALYPTPIPTKNPDNSSLLLPFSTSFIFSISPYPNRLPGHGFAFLFAPTFGINGTSSSQHLGLLNFTNNGNSNNRLFAIKFDVFENQEFNDVSNNHVGVNVNSLTSFVASEAGYWVGGVDSSDFRDLKLNNGENYQVWIDYLDSRIIVTMARVGMTRPQRPLINASLDLGMVFLDQMYIGFGGATGQLVESHRILSWAFSNSNFSIGDALVTTNLPSFVPPNRSVFRSKRFIVGVSVGGVSVIGLGIVIYIVLVHRRKRKQGVEEELEDWELQYWPHRIDYQEIFSATNGFSDENIIGYGGNGKVYRGVLLGGVVVAVKRISLGNEDGMKEFLAEVSSLGRLKHRNLVGLRGWCKGDKKSLILIYDYMENGSLDKRVFECEESRLLSWEERVKALKDVASGVLYLHDGWESTVLHRDIKASNVLLDKDMVARLGDFGLARMHHHGQSASTTRVVGTVGYMAPEVVRTGRASVQTDVFGFGVLVLEVVCGRRPIEEGKMGLVDWVFGLMERGELFNAIDERLQAKGGYVKEEASRVVHLGLLCVHPDPNKRPLMRQVLKVLEGTSEGNQSEGEGEGIEMNLLEPMIWSNYGQNVGGLGHPTYEDIRRASTSSISLNWSDIISEGR
ncbi:hypothetical protein LguiA_035163 [Lonicera macranthoides]